MKKPVTITLEEGLLEEIEEKRGAVARSRFVELLIQRTLNEENREEVPAGYV